MSSNSRPDQGIDSRRAQDQIFHCLSLAPTVNGCPLQVRHRRSTETPGSDPGSTPARSGLDGP
eukprot:614283-Hanusia_phi.AAC.1